MRYLLTLSGPEGGMEEATPEQMRAEMGRWGAFTQETVDAGVFISGEGLAPSSMATIVTVTDGGGNHEITDGPFAESKEVLGGFYLLECKDLDEALEWAKKIPVRGGHIEVRPVMDYEAAGAVAPPTAATAGS